MRALLAFSFLMLACASADPCRSVYGEGATADPAVEGWWSMEGAGRPMFTVTRHCSRGHRVLLFRKDQLLLDRLDLPKLHAGNYFLSGKTCSVNGEVDEEVFAVAPYRGSPDFEHVTRAWRANRTTGKFREIAVAGVTCWAEELSD